VSDALRTGELDMDAGQWRHALPVIGVPESDSHGGSLLRKQERQHVFGLASTNFVMNHDVR
jgi:hypothetical protein